MIWYRCGNRKEVLNLAGGSSIISACRLSDGIRMGSGTPDQWVAAVEARLAAIRHIPIEPAGGCVLTPGVPPTQDAATGFQ
ncbi:MAG: hypothetical protein OXH79_09415 [Boseongicola sp.]|nr:hypothetical protein [Boseongicola sp.]